MKKHEEFLLRAVRLAQKNREEGNRPFAALLVMDDDIIATGVNGTQKNFDACSHAELEAIRSASIKLKSVDLGESIIYASGHPCPMCLAAILMTNVKAVYYAFDNNDSAPFGFSSESTYKKLGIHMERLPIPFEKIDVGIPAAEVYGRS